MRLIETSLLRRSILSLHEIQTLVADKNVLLVGNSITALQKEQRDLIDSYDIVVRFGKGIVDGKEKYIGTRTHIWVTGGFRITMRNHFSEDVAVLFNIGSKVKGGVKPPPFKHTLMYTEDEIDEINRKHGQTGDKRLSTGALAAYYFANEVKTYKSLTFINFDMFRNNVKFYNNFDKSHDLAQSWHIPIPSRNSYDPEKGGADHPAHDIEIEKIVIDKICEQPNVYFIGEVPEKPQLIEIENASWDNFRQKLEKK